MEKGTFKFDFDQNSFVYDINNIIIIINSLDYINISTRKLIFLPFTKSLNEYTRKGTKAETPIFTKHNKEFGTRVFQESNFLFICIRLFRISTIAFPLSRY